MGTLYVVATPIGNLKDITLRALEVLREADLILAEDTRVSRKILSHYKISKIVKRYNEHAPERLFEELEKRFAANGVVAFVTDAGSPGISDPGYKLVSFARGIKARVEVIPGPSAVIAALSASGIPANEFTFLGYPPAKKKRKKFFERLKDIAVRPVVFYESPHRLQKTLADLEEVLGKDSNILVASEMTKIYEDYFTGSVEWAKLYFGDPKKGKGEFVLILP